MFTLLSYSLLQNLGPFLVTFRLREDVYILADILQKTLAISWVVFVLFLLRFKALFCLFPLHLALKIHWSFCPVFPAHMFSFIFRCRSVIDERFPNLVNGSYFLYRISREISASQKQRNVLNELRTRNLILRKWNAHISCDSVFAVRWKRKWGELHFTNFVLMMNSTNRTTDLNFT